VFFAHHVALVVGEGVEACLAHLAEMRPRVRPMSDLEVPHIVVFAAKLQLANWANKLARSPVIKKLLLNLRFPA
jgi:hypothetical protein